MNDKAKATYQDCSARENPLSPSNALSETEVVQSKNIEYKEIFFFFVQCNECMIFEPTLADILFVLSTYFTCTEKMQAPINLK